ncbi:MULTISPECIES: PhoH family protein [unclassified Oleiphilus]|uniref:PhoH family protein n=4 Tax=Oleiphilus TaxID=141450 RepID=UPI0009EF570E|nr:MULTISPECIES: PhoH family protein [unclassified Oleiphilus]
MSKTTKKEKLARRQDKQPDDKVKTTSTGSITIKEVALTPFDNDRLACLCGQFDENIKHLEMRLDVKISYRGAVFKIRGEKAEASQAALEIIRHLYRETEDNSSISLEMVHLFVQEFGVDAISSELSEEARLIKTPRSQVKPRGENQCQYVANIKQHDINFGLGPAGTGKTYLAVACAVEALNNEEVKRILLVRPAVEAGEKLGFLPGDLAQKVDPYLRPLYDALYEMLGFDQVAKLMDKNIIEVAPLAFMRGRTLNNAFIILDESQNTTPEQMKMFLTRIGFGSTAVITGDLTQTDLPKHAMSGLAQAQRVLNGVKGISSIHFRPSDVVRHPIVQRIVEAYNKHDTQGKA